MALRIRGIDTPIFCRTSGSDRWVLWQAFEERHFEIDLKYPPRLIIDGGANVGYASVYFANRYPDARIIAVEPDPENCAVFRKNCSAYPNVELIRGALWTSNADLTVQNPTDESWAFRVEEAPRQTSGAFKGLTVTDILRRSGEQNVDLLKIDIEGSEEQLFSYGYDAWISCVENVMIEIHGQRCRDAVLAATKDRGFTASRNGEYWVFTKEG